jgi:hypothetical protein
MTELSRSLLNAAREGLAPDADVAARVRARVGATVGAPVAKPVTGGLALRSEARVESPRVSASTTQPDIAEPAAFSTREHATTKKPSTPGPKATRVAPASLSREVELIDQAMTALRKHDPDAALAAMKSFDRETLGRAQMAEEAAAITIEARCFLGEDVSARIAAFDQTWPSSAERSRIADACAKR